MLSQRRPTDYNVVTEIILSRDESTVRIFIVRMLGRKKIDSIKRAVNFLSSRVKHKQNQSQNKQLN